jgi:hypothetical protein
LQSTTKPGSPPGFRDSAELKQLRQIRQQFQQGGVPGVGRAAERGKQKPQ